MFTKKLTFYLLSLLISITTWNTGFCQNPYPLPDYYPNDLPSDAYLYYENQGQIIDTDGNLRPDVLYYNQNGDVGLFMFEDKIAYTWTNPRSTLDEIDTTMRLDMLPYNDPKMAKISLNEQDKQYNNYYYEHCPNGITVDGHRRVVYENYLPNIDLQVYSNQLGMKLYFVLLPGADPELLKLQFQGQNNIQIINSQLEFYIGQDIFKIPQAVAYEVDYNHQVVPLSWSANFSLSPNGVVGFNTGNYNSENKLVYELAFPYSPTSPPSQQNLEWSTYYGGSSGSENFGKVTTDANGNQFAVGATTSSSLPVGIGTTYKGMGSDAFIVKFDTNNDDEWATYYGGSLEDEAHSVAVNSQGEPYMVGYTTNLNDGSTTILSFPLGLGNTFYFDDIVSPSTSANFHSREGFIVKFFSNGLRDFATLFGDSTDVAILDITIDNNDNTFISGHGPVPNVQGIDAGGGFVAQFDNQFDLIWSTQTGGTGIYSNLKVPARSIAVDANNNVFIAGSTSDLGPNFKVGINTKNFAGGSSDIFITKYDFNRQIIWSTYYGGSDSEIFEALHIDNFNNVYIAGTTASNDYPTKTNNANGVLFKSTISGPQDAFFSKFENTGSELWSTYWGGQGYDEGMGITTDALRNIYFLANTYGSSLPIKTFGNNLYYNQSTINGNIDMYIGVLRWNSVPEWMTYFGGATEYGESIEISGNNLYVSGLAKWGFILEQPNGAYFQSSPPPSNRDHACISKFSIPEIITSLNSTNIQSDLFQVSPNPSDNFIQIDGGSEYIEEIQVINVLGGIIHNINNINANQYIIDTSQFPSGTYFLQLKAKTGKLQTKKIVIQH